MIPPCTSDFQVCHPEEGASHSRDLTTCLQRHQGRSDRFGRCVPPIPVNRITASADVRSLTPALPVLRMTGTWELFSYGLIVSSEYLPSARSSTFLPARWLPWRDRRRRWRG